MAVVESWSSRRGFDQGGHLQGLIVGEKKDGVERVTRNIVVRVYRVRGIAPELTTYFDRVRFVYPGKRVLVIDPVLKPPLGPGGISETGDRRQCHRRNFRMRRVGVPTLIPNRAELEFVNLVWGKDMRFVQA